LVESQEKGIFTFINNYKRLCKNPGKLWEAARYRTKWENIIA